MLTSTLISRYPADGHVPGVTPPALWITNTSGYPTALVDRTSWRWYDIPIVIAGGLVAALVAGQLAGIDPVANDAHTIFWFVVPAQNLGQVATLALVGRMRGHRDVMSELGLAFKSNQLWWLVAGAVSLIPLGYLATLLRLGLGVEDGSPQQAVVEAATEVRGTITMLAVVVGVVMLGPLSEELIFRGLMVRIALSRGLSSRLAVFITAVAFAAVHLADRSLISRSGMVTVAILLLFGLFLGAIRMRTGNLGPAILTHAGFNLGTVLLLFLFEAT